MPRKSAIDTLDPAIRSAVLHAIDDGATIDDIVDLVREMGGVVSRSSVGRYTKGFAELAKQQRDMRSVAEAFGREFGSADDHQARMMTQLITSLVTRTLIPLATADQNDEDGDGPMSGLELSRLAKAAKDAVSASKIDIEREGKIRDEEARRTREKAAAEADAEGRAAGASDETIRRIRARILGIAA